MTPPALDERSREVLKSLIQVHVATGEPVGSENLAQVMGRALSSATLRGIMADLEKKGYLDHPHTSAGRLPTDEGYRAYVDSLMGPATLAARDAAAITSAIRGVDGAPPEQVMENASHVLSRQSGNLGFVLIPDLDAATFRHVDLVRLPHPRILVVLVSMSGLVTNKVIEVDDDMTQDDLQACANYLNVNFSGLALPTIRLRLLDLMQQEKALYDSLLKRAVSVGERAFSGAGEPSVYLDGASNILRQPELADRDLMQALFQAFEEKGRLVKIVNACLSPRGVRITIGHENPDPDLHSVALVTATIPLEAGAGWGLGVMGSTRMEYPRMIALVEHVARALDQALKELRP
jgi:heat-inducible transcriptional repressor